MTLYLLRRCSVDYDVQYHPVRVYDAREDAEREAHKLNAERLARPEARPRDRDEDSDGAYSVVDLDYSPNFSDRPENETVRR